MWGMMYMSRKQSSSTYYQNNNAGAEGYSVVYRAYLNGLATDDVLSVNYTTDGKLWHVSADKLLCFVDVDTSALPPPVELEQAVRDYVHTLQFEDIEKREDEPVLYTMNLYGKVYYVSTWYGFSVNPNAGNRGGHTIRVGVKAKP